MRKQSKTIIAAIKTRAGKIIMAGDRRVSVDWGTAYNCPFPKIAKKHNGMLIGASGDSALCKIVVDVFEPAECTGDVEEYMYREWPVLLEIFLKQQPGYRDGHGQLQFAVEEQCTLLIALQGRLFSVDIGNHEAEQKDTALARIVVDDLPLPFALGCGAATSLPVLSLYSRTKGYNTKDELKEAVEMAIELSPGCGAPIDYISED